MTTCDVLIVGGGPAGSTCAARLQKAGLTVLLLDKDIFPRSKPCAGWITPPVLTTLAIDREDYCRSRVLQEIRGFHTGLIDGPGMDTRYGTTVSYGIRRCEFDQYLLERSAVCRELGEPVVTLARHDGGWLVNGRIKARLLVGAGGHFCPVARLLGAKSGSEQIITAQVAEFAMEPEQERLAPVPADTPALYFCRDLKGYGWLFRKGRFLNIGLGRMDREHLGRHTRAFCTFLQQRGYLAADFNGRFRGHAYGLYRRQGGRSCVGDGALLIGDAAGLARPQSGEGILPAIESALLAAATILTANGDYRRDNLEPYAVRLVDRFGPGSDMSSSPVVSALGRGIGARLFASHWFTRHVVLDRWFLHTNDYPLDPGECAELL